MTQCTHYGFCCFFFTERIDERNIKALTAASKARPTTFVGAWVFFIRKCCSVSFADILEVCKFGINAFVTAFNPMTNSKNAMEKMQKSANLAE